MRPEKAWIVQNLKGIAQSQAIIIMTDYTGLPSEALEKLRRDLKQAAGSYLVVKDRLLRLAIKEIRGVDIEPVNRGPTGIAYGDDPVSVAKAVKVFSSENEAFKIKAGILKGVLLDKARLIELAKVPSRQVLIAQLVGLLKRPVSDFVYVLNAPLAKLVMALAQIRDKKEKEDGSAGGSASQ